MAKKPAHELTKKIREKIRQAIKEYGRYQYFDKGPSEVMNVVSLSADFVCLTQTDRLTVIEELGKGQKTIVFIQELLTTSEKLLTCAELRNLVMSSPKEVREFFNIEDPSGAITYDLV